MRPEAGSITRAAHVAHKKLLVRITQMQLGFEAVVIKIPLGQPIAEKDNTLAHGRRSDGLGPLGRSGGRHGHLRVRGIFRRSVHRDDLLWRGGGFRLGLGDWQPGGGAFAWSVIVRLEVPVPVKILLIDADIFGGRERINIPGVSFSGDRAASEMQRRIDHEPAQVLVRKICGGTHRGAKSLALFGAVRGGVSPQPCQGHHGIVLRAGNGLGGWVQRFRDRATKEDGGGFLIEIGNAIDIGVPKDFAHPAQHFMFGVGLLHNTAGAFHHVVAMVIHPVFPKNIQAKIRPLEVTGLRLPSKGMGGGPEADHRFPCVQEGRKMSQLVIRKLPEPGADDQKIG